MYSLARPLLFSLDAERAHALALRSIDTAYRTGTTSLLSTRPVPLPTPAFGLMFPNPVGLGAGLDKNGEHIDALLALGFGFVEIGTVTPRAQDGNPKPRMFRLPEYQAVINRMGFNNLGVDALVAMCSARAVVAGCSASTSARTRTRPTKRPPATTATAWSVYPLADYITVNISSPNTAGLRELQEEQSLRRLISDLRETQEALGAQHGKRVPMLVKVAPDLNDRDIDAAARVLADLAVDGVIATNTTVTRP